MKEKDWEVNVVNSGDKNLGKPEMLSYLNNFPWWVENKIQVNINLTWTG